MGTAFVVKAGVCTRRFALPLGRDPGLSRRPIRPAAAPARVEDQQSQRALLVASATPPVDQGGTATRDRNG
jgi:hypothetical protein